MPGTGFDVHAPIVNAGKASHISVWTAGLLGLLMGLTSCGMGGPMQPTDGSGGDDVNDATPVTSPRTCGKGEAIGETTVSYADDIVPIIEMRGCLTSGCHGGGLVAFNYSLETYEGIFGPGYGARTLGTCNVVPGDPSASFLIEKLTSEAPRAGQRMPLNRDPLSAEEIELIRTWIAEGAAHN